MEISKVIFNYNINNSYFYRVIVGISEETETCHIVKATLEAVCYQTRDILDAMNKDYGSYLSILQVSISYIFSIQKHFIRSPQLFNSFKNQ